MEVKLTKEELQNIIVALIRVAKMPDIPAEQISYLFDLSKKFIYKEMKKEITAEDIKKVGEMEIKSQKDQ